MNTLDVPDMIATFAENDGQYVVTRRATGGYDSGGAVIPPTTSTVSVLACFWPATGRDLQRLPEGRRAVETMAGVCDTRLSVGGQGSAFEADLVTIGGESWEVQHVASWPNFPGFWGILAQRPNLP